MPRPCRRSALAERAPACTIAVVARWSACVAIGGAAPRTCVLKRDPDVRAARRRARSSATRSRPTPKEVARPSTGRSTATTTQRTRYLPTKRVEPPFDASDGASRPASCSSSRRSWSTARSTSRTRTRSSTRSTPSTGKVEWKKQIGDLNASSPAYSRRASVRGQPRARRQAIAVLRAPTTARCSGRTRCPGAARPRPLVVGSKVIVGSESGDVFALDAKTGKTTGRCTPPARSRRPRRSTTGILYVGNYGGEMFALRGRRTAQSSGSRAPRARASAARAGLLDPRSPSVASTSAASTAASTASTQETGELPGATRPATGSTPAPAVADTPRTAADRLLRLQGPELLRARRGDRRGALAAATSAA